MAREIDQGAPAAPVANVGVKSSGRRAGWPVGWTALLVASLGVIAVATLRPGSDQPSLPGWEICIACGETGGASALLNVLLFVPLGAALAAIGGRMRRAVLLGAITSLAVEVAQWWVPGRHPTLGDLVCNTLGAMLGGWFALHRATLLRPSPAMRGRLVIASGAMVAGIIVASGILFQPAPTRDLYFGQWTPSLGHLEPYHGRLLYAAIGGRRVPSGPLPEDPGLAGRIAAGERVELRAIAGPPPQGLASLFSIYDDHQREILLVGIDREDVVLRYRRRAAGLRLEQPELRWRAALAGIPAGDTVRLDLIPTRSGACLEGLSGTHCVAGPRPGDGWQLLTGPGPLRGASHPWLRAVWASLLLAPLGLWAARDRATALALTLVSAALVFTTAAGLLHSPGAPETMAAGAALASGVAVQRLLRARRAGGNRPRDALAAPGA